MAFSDAESRAIGALYVRRQAASLYVSVLSTALYKELGWPEALQVQVEDERTLEDHQRWRFRVGEVGRHPMVTPAGRKGYQATVSLKSWTLLLEPGVRYYVREHDGWWYPEKALGALEEE